MTSAIARLLITAGSMVAAPAAAQHADIGGDPMDRIVVTASRAPLDLRRIGSATTVITRDEIERRQARYLSDLLRSVPGFGFSLSGGIGSQTQARVRGGEANHVLVLVDGVRANDPATGDEFRWEHLTLGNVERVEVVRGPQSALWGSDAISAVVNVITRAESSGSNIDGYLETGSNDTTNAGMNAVLGRNAWILNGSVESLDTDGTNIARTGNEADGANLVAGSIGLRYAGPAGLDFDASLRATEGTSQYDDVDFAVTGLPVDADLETKSNNLIGSFGVSFGTDDDRVRWRFSAGYFDSRHRDFVDGAEDTRAASERADYGIQANIDLGRNSLSLALERESTDFEQRGPVDFGDPNQDQTMQVTSSIAEYRHLAGERMTWLIGGRYDRNSDFDNALTGRVSMAFELSDATRLRASVGTGQKAPTFIERFGLFPDEFIGNPGLKPETSLSYDFGVDHEWPDHGLEVNATLYAQQLENEIDGFVPDPETFQFTAENQPGRSDRNGIELAAQWSPNEAVALGASVTYTDATEPNDLGIRKRELRRPRHSGGLSFTWQPPANTFEIAFFADYGGKRDDSFFPPFPEPSRRLTLPDYWLVELAAHYRVTPSITLFARGANLLDERYEQLYGYATPGRTAYVGFRTDFAGR